MGYAYTLVGVAADVGAVPLPQFGEVLARPNDHPEGELEAVREKEIVADTEDETLVLGVVDAEAPDDSELEAVNVEVGVTDPDAEPEAVPLAVVVLDVSGEFVGVAGARFDCVVVPVGE